MGQARITHLIRAGAIAVAGSIAVVLPLGALGASTGGAASASTVNPLGVYAGPASPGVVKALGASIGQQPTYAMEFLDGSTWSSIENPSWFVSQWQNSGYKMIWGVPILPNTFSPNSNASVAGGSAYGLAQGAGGAFNSYFVTLAKAFVAAGQGSSIIRLGWEFNGGWFPWAANGSSATFVAYWQNIVNAMRSVSGQSFTFEWNPTLGDQGVGNLANYYPGNNYVDYIGDDVYDVAWATYPGAAAEFSYMETEPYGLNWLASFAASVNKPITFPEWGLGWGPSNNGGPVTAANTEVSGGDNPTFIKDMAKWIAVHHVYEATFWDYGSGIVSSRKNPNAFVALVHLGPSI